MSMSPRDIRRNMSARRTQQNPTSIMETAIPPKSQKSGAILMEKMDLQLALTKECDRKLDEYEGIFQGMDRMLMEYDNQLMECQMQLSKYDNQLMESQKLLSDCSSRLLNEAGGAVLTKELIEQYDGALAEYKNAVDKYYGLIEQYQEQIKKLMGTEEDRMAGVQMALDLTYIKEELDELKQYIESAMKPEEPEAEETPDETEEEGEQVIEKLFDVWDETNLKRFQAEIKLIEDKSEHILKTVQDVVHTHNTYIDGKFKDLDGKLLTDERIRKILDEQFKLADARREEAILKQNQTLTEKLQAQNNLLGDKLEDLNEVYTQTLEEKLLAQSKTMVDKLQVQNHFLEEVEEGQNRFITESLNKQNEFLNGRLAQQGKGLEELIEKKGTDIEGKIGAKLEELLKKPEEEKKEGEEEEEDEVVKLLNESKAKQKEDREEFIRKFLGIESLIKDEKGQVTTAKSELTVLIDRTMGPVERKVGKLSRLTLFSLILNIASLLGIAALLMQIYGL